MPDELPAAPVTLALYLDARTPFPDARDMNVTIGNNAGLSRNFWGKTPNMQITLPFHDGPGDDYRIVVQVDGYRDGGGFVQANPHVHPMVSLLMIPSHPKFSFPEWADLQTSQPATAALIAANSQADAEARYLALGTDHPLSLACLMNLAAAMNVIGLGAQETPLDFIKQVIWDNTLAQDRFFGYADPDILKLLEAAADEGEFARQPDADLALHPGATSSYKQTEFAYSNVQLTFHAHDTATIGTLNCIKIEPDMDLYKEVIAHGLGEVLPNWITHNLTSPIAVLALRWIDAVQSNEPLFDPGYTLS